MLMVFVTRYMALVMTVIYCRLLTAALSLGCIEKDVALSLGAIRGHMSTCHSYLLQKNACMRKVFR